jgi:hypothetical protein
MPNLTDREKRTVRLAAIGIAIYLACFLSWRGWRAIGAGAADTAKLAARVATAEAELATYENKVLLFEKLSETYRLDPRKLDRESLVANASAAIQTAARESGIRIGPMRENAGRASGRELASIQFEATAAVTNTLGLLHRVPMLGYPILVDTVQFTPMPQPPGVAKMNVTIVILNPDHWLKGEKPNA